MPGSLNCGYFTWLNAFIWVVPARLGQAWGWRTFPTIMRITCGPSPFFHTLTSWFHGWHLGPQMGPDGSPGAEAFPLVFSGVTLTAPSGAKKQRTLLWLVGLQLRSPDTIYSLLVSWTVVSLPSVKISQHSFSWAILCLHLWCLLVRKLRPSPLRIWQPSCGF